jgi:hypothetical protein
MFEESSGCSVRKPQECLGTDEAMDVSLELVAERDRIATIANFRRGFAEGIKVLGGGPGSRSRGQDPRGSAARAGAPGRRGQTDAQGGAVPALRSGRSASGEHRRAPGGEAGVGTVGTDSMTADADDGRQQLLGGAPSLLVGTIGGVGQPVGKQV